MMRTGAGGISPHDEVCQSRKQITGKRASRFDQARCLRCGRGFYCHRACASIPGSILTSIAQMTDTETVMNLLRKVPLFANLRDEDKVCIEETEEWRLPEGKLLVEEGKHASAITLSADERFRLIRN